MVAVRSERAEIHIAVTLHDGKAIVMKQRFHLLRKNVAEHKRSLSDNFLSRRVLPTPDGSFCFDLLEGIVVLCARYMHLVALFGLIGEPFALCFISAHGVTGWKLRTYHKTPI